MKIKKAISLLLAATLIYSPIGSNFIPSAGTEVMAAGVQDYIIDNGDGTYSANFPDEYPEELIIPDDDATIERKVTALLKTLTEDEKIGMLSADGSIGDAAAHDSQQWLDKRYGTGFWKGVGRLGIPVIRMYDGPMGVRSNAGYETTRPPSEVSVASSFDKEAAYEYGALYASENKANAGNNQLGDQNDLIRRVSTSRSRDMFSEDWYMSGVVSYEMSAGLEDNNVMATLKHFGGVGNVDEQTLFENYYSATEMAISSGGASAVMTNYGTVNGVSACVDSYMLKDVLRGMWNFKGIVMTDWAGNYGFSVHQGVTMETPTGDSTQLDPGGNPMGKNSPDDIRNALANGTITWDDIDEAVGYNLYALGKTGYLGLIVIDGRYGKTAVDESKIYEDKCQDTDQSYIIELPLTDGDERQELLDENNEKAIELAEKGAVLLKNDNNDTLPLSSDENVAMIGLGSTYLVAGHQHECSFGSLRGLSVSPYDALTDIWPESNIDNYVAQDIVGEAVPGEYLYQDAEGTTAGVIRTGTHNDGSAADEVDEDINFVTNTNTYKNGIDGTAFPYAEDGTGVNYTWTTYLKAPETGTYTIGVQGISWRSISATMERTNQNTGAVTSGSLGSAGGSLAIGAFGSTGIVTSETGLDVPTNNTQMYLEEGKLYRVTITGDSSMISNYDFLRGVKDAQVRLSWITPSQKENNYSDALEAAGTPGTTVVLFAHSLENGMSFESIANQSKTQPQMINDMVAAAKVAGNKTVLVLSTGLPSNIKEWAVSGSENEVDAILQMWLPGQGGGTAIANLISGQANPSGKLSVTWPLNASGNTAIDDQQAALNGSEKNGRTDADSQPTDAPGRRSQVSTEVREGIFNGYKWYDATDSNDKVLYDFGYGLSYTQFDYELVSVDSAVEGIDNYGYDFTVKVTNTGDEKGSDAPQIYIGAAAEELIDGEVYYTPDKVNDSFRYVWDESIAEEDQTYGNAEYFPLIDGVQQAKYQLVGYERTKVLEPGESDIVTIHVNERALSYWDASIDDDQMTEREDGTRHKYVVIEGEREFFLGKSSDEFVDTETVDVKRAADVVTVTLDQSGLTLEEGQSAALTATLDPADAVETLTWSSSDNSIATVNNDGLVTAVKAGSAVITVTLSNGRSASCTVTVTENAGEQANKATLKKWIDYAEEQMQLEEYKYVVADVKAKFETALENAKAVYSDSKATQQETYDAWTTLMKWTHALGIQTGDKTLLLEAITAAGTINLDNYVTLGQEEFKAALQNAKDVYNTELISQDEIDAATDRLIDAMMVLRYKADKAILDSLLLYARTIDYSIYTADSVSVFRAAMAAADEVLQEELSVDEQDVVDNAVVILQAAIDGLTRIDDTNGNTGEDTKDSMDDTNGSTNDDTKDSNTDDTNKGGQGTDAGGKGKSDTNTGKSGGNTLTKSPKTGDTSAKLVVTLFLLSVLSAGAIVIVYKKKRS